MIRMRCLATGLGERWRILKVVGPPKKISSSMGFPNGEKFDRFSSRMAHAKGSHLLRRPAPILSRSRGTLRNVCG